MKRTVFGMATLLLLSTAPCVANAFTAIAWSQSGQKGGSIKNAPTKEAAISAAIADCKKSGGGSDCQVFKVTDEPGFVALYATCAKTCGVTAVTGRPTAEQARAEGKRECEAYYRASCQLAQEWEETPSPTGTNKNDTNQKTQNAQKADTGILTKKDFDLDNGGWEFSKAGNGGVKWNFWYHPSTIRKNGNLVSLFAMQVFHKSVTYNEANINSAVYKYEFDCAAEKMFTLGRALYTSNFGKGEIYLIEQGRITESPDRYSMISNIWEKACGKEISEKLIVNKPRRKNPENTSPAYHNEERLRQQEFMIEQRRELRNECDRTGSCGELNRFDDRQLYQHGFD